MAPSPHAAAWTNEVGVKVPPDPDDTHRRQRGPLTRRTPRTGLGPTSPQGKRCYPENGNDMLETVAALDELETTVATTPRPGVSLEIDLSAVEHLDPATLGALWRMSREARARGSRVQVHDPHAVLERTDAMLRS